MKAELMNAMIEKAPEKARALMDQGTETFGQTVQDAMKRANPDPTGELTKDDPALAVMYREMMYQDALDELTS